MASTPASLRTITDAAGQQVLLPPAVERVICSGAGALRLLTYLECQNRIVAVDDMEVHRAQFDARPYGPLPILNSRRFPSSASSAGTTIPNAS